MYGWKKRGKVQAIVGQPWPTGAANPTEKAQPWLVIVGGNVTVTHKISQGRRENPDFKLKIGSSNQIFRLNLLLERTKAKSEGRQNNSIICIPSFENSFLYSYSY